MTTAHDFSAIDIDGNERSLSEFSGKTMVIVNVASKCGFTPHYRGLEALYRDNVGSDVVVLGFPCDQFGAQEPGTEAEIKDFCTSKYDVTFPMFSKVEVNGEGAHPLYVWLTAQDTQPDGPGDIQWNFAKFVIGPDGTIRSRLGPDTDPASIDVG